MRRAYGGCSKMTEKFSKRISLPKKIREFLLLSTSLYPALTFVGVFLLGVIVWGGFNWSLEMTNTESFCISCHVMKDNVYQEYKKTIHYTNRTGVRATCPDCHVPREWGHKVVRKIRATNELFHWMAGSINSREKFQAKRAELARHVWDSMSATDSRECRNCHDNASMNLATQNQKAAIVHGLATEWKMTCITCHKGIAHTLPANFSKNTLYDKLHERFEREKIECSQCHKDMAGSKKKDEW